MTSTERTVWKFDLLPGVQKLKMPAGAELLSVGVQGSSPNEKAVLWALVDPDRFDRFREIGTVPTGGNVTGDATFVGTFQIESGLVFHVFDGGEQLTTEAAA